MSTSDRTIRTLIAATLFGLSATTSAWSQTPVAPRPAPLVSDEFPAESMFAPPGPQAAPVLPGTPLYSSIDAQTAGYFTPRNPNDANAVQQTSAQVGMSPYSVPSDRPLSETGEQYPYNGTAPVSSQTIQREETGRLINSSLGDDWFDYCAPNVRACYRNVYGSVDAWWMHRNDATWKNLVRAEGNGQILARSRDPDFNLETIPILTLGRTFCDWTLEGKAYYKDDIDAHTDASDFIPAATIFFGLQNAATSDYRFAQSERVEIRDGFHSYEFNAINTVDFFNWMIGVRYVEFREMMSVTSQRLVGPPVGSSVAQIGTYNRMIGGQIGFRLNYEVELMTYQLNVKTGLYHNDAHIGTTVRDFNNTTVIIDRQTGGQNEAWLSEAQAMVGYSPYMWLTLRASYQFMYINEIALAPDQIIAANDGIGTGTVANAKGDMFMHGPQLGMELKW